MGWSAYKAPQGEVCISEFLATLSRHSRDERPSPPPRFPAPQPAPTAAGGLWRSAERMSPPRQPHKHAPTGWPAPPSGAAARWAGL